MKRRIALVLVLLAMGTAHGTTVRRAVGAGPLYPLDFKTLLDTLSRFHSEANVTPLPGRLVACVAPFDGYGLSGGVAAHAFKQLKPGQYDRVVVLGCSNFTQFEGCSIPAVEAYVTPLGFVPLDKPAIEKLCRSSLIRERSVRYADSPRHIPVHEREYSIENMLPFLQERMGDSFLLVPIVIGRLSGQAARLHEQSVANVAEAVRGIVDDRTLVVVASHFTHYGREFGNVPGGDNPAEAIERLDKQAFELITEPNPAAFNTYLRVTRNRINGAEALRVLMAMLPGGVQAEVTAYELSGRLMRTLDTRSVSYAAISFYDPKGTARTPPPRPAPDGGK